MCIDYINTWSCGHAHSIDSESCRNYRRNRYCEVQDVYQTVPGFCENCSGYNTSGYRSRSARPNRHHHHDDFGTFDSPRRARRSDRHHDHFDDGHDNHHRRQHRAGAPSPSPPPGDDDITGHFTEGNLRITQDDNDPTAPPQISGYVNESNFRWTPEDGNNNHSNGGGSLWGGTSNRRHGQSQRSRSPDFGRGSQDHGGAPSTGFFDRHRPNRGENGDDLNLDEERRYNNFLRDALNRMGGMSLYG